jgi:hypothetical protein
MLAIKPEDDGAGSNMPAKSHRLHQPWLLKLPMGA